MNNTVTISRKEYEDLLRAKQERDRLRVEIGEVEIHAEQREAEAQAEAAAEIKDEQKRTCFWARAWFDVLFWLQGAWQQVHALSKKVIHTEKLMANPKLKPEQRLYLYAAAPLAIAPKHRDKEGRAQIARAEVAQRAGLPESTCYRAAKELESVGIIDANSPYNPLKGKRVRFEKFAAVVATDPDKLDSQAPQNGGYHPACNACESDDTIVERKTIQTITCRDCGTQSTTILPARVIYNPLYQTSEQDDTSPGKSHHVRMRKRVESGPKASEGNSA